MGLLSPVTDEPLVPEGVSHDADLSGMTPGQRQRHHTRQLGQIAFYDGKNGVDAYKQRHPEAGQHRVNLNAIAYVPKPSGYSDAVANMVGHWFDSDTALAATNKADVHRLNARLETDRFDPGSHFSKPMPPALRKRVATIFEQRGATLPPSVKSLSAVRRAVRAFKAGSLSTARAFGSVGSRTGDTLAIGRRTFPIVRHGDHECIRVTAGGKTQRIALDIVEAILSGLPDEIGGGNSAPIIIYNIADVVHGPEIAQAAPLAETICGRTCPAPEPLENSAADVVHGPASPPSLADRIRALRAVPALPSPAVAADRDPLEITTDDV